MAIVQSTYVENIAPAIRGQPANSQTCDADSYVAEGIIPFARAARQGSEADRARVGMGVNDFLGVSFKDSTRDPSEDDNYADGAHAALVFRGDIWIDVDAAVNARDNVTADSEDGSLSSAPSDAIARIEITNGGSGYTSAPTVSFSGGGGTGAAGTAVISGGVVTGVTITNAGSGYASRPTIAFAGGGGSNAAGEVVLDREPVPGARWMSAAAANGLAVLRLGTHLPSA